MLSPVKPVTDIFNQSLKFSSYTFEICPDVCGYTCINDQSGKPCTNHKPSGSVFRPLFVVTDTLRGKTKCFLSAAEKN